MRRVLALSAGILMGLAALTLWGGGAKHHNNRAKDAEFTKLYERGRSARVRITYRQRSPSGAAAGTWTYAQDGDTKKVYIRKGSKWVVIGGTAYRCRDTDTRARCEELPSGAPSVGARVAAFAAGYTGFAYVLAEDANSLAFTNSSNTTIAGRDAVCATMTVADGAPLLATRVPGASGARGTGWESCLDKQTGVVLRVHVVVENGDEAGAELIATLVETPVEADFATPGAPPNKRSTTSSGSPRATPDTSTRDVTVTTAIGCALTMTLTPGETLPRSTTVPCVQPG